MRRLLTNARIVDGTGAPAYEGEVLLEDDRVAEVGACRGGADETVDVDGQVVAPGFLDMHSHSDFALLDQPEARAKVLQGVTTEVVGNCGLGMFPSNDRVDAYYEMVTPMLFGEPGRKAIESVGTFRRLAHERGISVNAACLVPHGNVRVAVCGVDEREPTAAELRRMQDLVAAGMEDGAFGLSTGLVYPPGSYAQTEEVIALAKVAAENGGFYATHMRDEGAKVVESVEEAIRIGREAGLPVQISHHKAAGRFNWGKVKKTLALVEDARAQGMDVTSDAYPYTAGSTILSAIFIPPWAFEGGLERLMERLRDPAMRARIEATSKTRTLQFVNLPGLLDRIPKRMLLPVILREMAKVIVVSSVPKQPHYEGLTLWDVAQSRGQRLYDAMMDLLLEEDTAVAAIAFVMREQDVQTVLSHATTMIGTDGMPLRQGKPHPRTFGTYPRVFERYVREERLLTLESAVHKCTGMVAAKLRLRDRGVLAPGARADVLVFDPDAIHDRSTYEEPRQHPTGLTHVFVNGAWTVKDSAHTGARAGRVLDRRAR